MKTLFKLVVYQQNFSRTSDVTFDVIDVAYHEQYTALKKYRGMSKVDTFYTISVYDNGVWVEKCNTYDMMLKARKDLIERTKTFFITVKSFLTGEVIGTSDEFYTYQKAVDYANAMTNKNIYVEVGDSFLHDKNIFYSTIYHAQALNGTTYKNNRLLRKYKKLRAKEKRNG